MRDIQTVIDSIQIKREQQRFDLEVLALWAHAEKHTGKTYPEIKAFTFRPEYLTKVQKKQNQLYLKVHRKPMYCDKNWHNCVRLANGDLLQIPGIQRPIPPSWMNSDVKKVISL